MRLNLVLTSYAGRQGPLPFKKEKRVLVSRQQEPNFSSALGRQGACRLTLLASHHTLLLTFPSSEHTASASLITP